MWLFKILVIVLYGLIGGQLTLALSFWVQEPVSSSFVSDLGGNEEISLFGLVKYLAVSVPALLILFVELYLSHKARIERERREEERDNKLLGERMDLVKNFTETAKASLLALSEHGRIIQNNIESCRQNNKSLEDLVRTGYDQILRRIDSIDRKIVDS